MSSLSYGKIRGLQQISSPGGIMTMCAIDHRGSMQRMLSREAGIDAGYDEMVRYKLELCEALAPHSSAVLLDPEYGAAQSIAAGVLPGDTGLLVSVEASEYEQAGDGRITEVLPDWSVQKIKLMGASAVKILIYYRPDKADLARQQEDTVRRLAEDCDRFDIPFLVEPVTYTLSREDRASLSARKADLVVQTARRITSLPIDVLKAEFPVDLQIEKDEGRAMDACQRLNEASQLPWVILSAGVDYETFCRQVDMACRAGACGFLGGRAIWQDALRITDSAERVRFLKTTVADRMKGLVEIAARHAAPWYRKLGIEPNNLMQVFQGWYTRYPQRRRY